MLWMWITMVVVVVVMVCVINNKLYVKTLVGAATSLPHHQVRTGCTVAVGNVKYFVGCRSVTNELVSSFPLLVWVAWRVWSQDDCVAVEVDTEVVEFAADCPRSQIVIPQLIVTVSCLLIPHDNPGARITVITLHVQHETVQPTSYVVERFAGRD